MSGVLSIQFWRASGGAWRFALHERSSLDAKGEIVHPERAWPDAPDAEDLFATLFGNDRDVVTGDRAWRVRVRPRELPAKPSHDALPDFEAWPCLVHDDDYQHVFLRGWTLSETSCAGPPSVVRDAVAVLDATGTALLASLRDALGPRVDPASAEGPLPEETVLVVGGRLDDKAAQALQFRAAKARCPLVVWCADAPPPTRPLNEVVTLDAPKEPVDRWLARFLPGALTGDVEQAFAGATAHPDGRDDLTARWLRGNFDRWKTHAKRDCHDFPELWDAMIDRSAQEKELIDLLDIVTAPRSRRRVQVVVSTGPRGAGLRRFQARPPRFSAGSDAWLAVEPVELDWHEAPERQLLRLCAALGASSPEALGGALAARQRRRGKSLLVWVRHALATLDGDPAEGARAVTLEALDAYAQALVALGATLPAEVRLVAHVSVRSADASTLEGLYRDAGHGAVQVIEAITANVDAKDLRKWFAMNGLTPHPGELEALAGLSYDALVLRLRDRISPRGTSP